jgi:hypothetical protein
VQKTTQKSKLVFHCGNSLKVFRNLPSSTYDGPIKFDVIKLWQFTQKTDGECWQLAQWLYDHWHIAAITARYANGLEAES